MIINATDRYAFTELLADVIRGCANDIYGNAGSIARSVDLPTGDVEITITIPSDTVRMPMITVRSEYYSVSRNENYYKSRERILKTEKDNELQ